MGDLVRPARPVADELRRAREDPRVAAVLAVLAGQPVLDAADTHDVDPALLERWVGAFVDAGAAHVTNRPDSGAAQVRDRFLAASLFGLKGSAGPDAPVVKRVRAALG